MIKCEDGKYVIKNEKVWYFFRILTKILGIKVSELIVLIYMDLITFLTAILLPPLAVFLKVGLTTQFWINVILTMLGYVPGIFHAFWVIFSL